MSFLSLPNPKRSQLVAAILFCSGFASAASAGSTDAIFIASPSRDAPSYESDHGAESRLRGIGATPEEDARPGEYYFLLGAHAYQAHDYAHAIAMYQVAASWAYKPAEYNLGVMYARGQGVTADLPRAMAWMALAAERNEPHYVDAREAIYAELSKEQFEQANVMWRNLKKTYGDEVALRRAKARWAEVKAKMTGSRVGSVGNLQVGMPNPSAGDPSFAKVANPQVEKQLQGFDGDKGHIRSGVNTARSTVGSAAEVTGGQGIDASIAYRQLRESDNPYDPKFDRGPIGKATVGPLQPVNGNGAPTDKAAPADKATEPESQP